MEPMKSIKKLKDIKPKKVYASSYTMICELSKWSNLEFEGVVEYLIRFILTYSDEKFIEEWSYRNDNVKFLSVMKEMGLEKKIAELKQNKVA